MSRTIIRIGALIATVGALVALTALPASAHHVLIDFDATDELVPGGGGDPTGTATGVVDFNSEESPNVCITGQSNLEGIVDVLIIAKADDSILLDFDGSLDNCVEATDEQRHELHDAADAYLLLITTEAYPEGAVASELVEQEPTTTTSSTVPEESTSTTASTAPAATTSPRFTG